jgi:hypothetical protein
VDNLVDLDPGYNTDNILPNNRNEYEINRSKWRPRG